MDSEHHNPWTTRGKKLVYETNWFRIQEHDVLRPDGLPGKYSFMEVRQSVGVLAINERQEIALVGQWRYAIGQYTWEIVRGGADPGETDMLAVARRELLEETGFEAEHWVPMDAVYTCTGLTNDHQFFFLATGLRFAGLHADPNEPIEVQWLPIEEAYDAVTSGRIVDVCTVAALLKYRFVRERRS